MTTSRPLKRSQTISVTDHAYHPSHNNLNNNFQHSLCGLNKKTPKTMPKITPERSCQAIRHAVSALTRMDDFISEKLGDGFFAQVYKVTHRTTGEVMVLKINSDYHNRMSMLREIQLMNRLAHPNILRFLGVCVNEGQLHALTEYMNKGSLNQVLLDENIELPWTTKVSLSLDIANGMKYLHSRGILHRDLTSRNVLIHDYDDGELHAVVADFGLAEKIPTDRNSKKLPIVGTPYWIAPEVLHEKWYDEKADLFSFGIIMCEITARIDADPDYLPRTQNFGLDYVAFSEKVDYCPLDFLRLAYTCCNMDPLRRPSFSKIVESLQTIQHQLENNWENKPDSTPKSGHKRSRSLDNYLLSDDVDQSKPVIVVTPQIIGEAMIKDDPYYTPGLSNPFINFSKFPNRKILEAPFDHDSFGYSLPSPSYDLTPPCTPRTPDYSSDKLKHFRTLSLPSSPILLRKAAERLHLESIHGSGRRYSTTGKRFSFSVVSSRSRNALFSEAVAYRLQNELGDRVQNEDYSMKESSSCENIRSNNNFLNYNANCDSSFPGKSRRKLNLSQQTSVDTDCDEAYKCTNGCSPNRISPPCQEWTCGNLHPSAHEVRDYVSSISSADSYHSLEDSFSAISPSEESCQDLFLSYSELRAKINQARSPRNSIIVDPQSESSCQGVVKTESTAWKSSTQKLHQAEVIHEDSEIMETKL